MLVKHDHRPIVIWLAICLLLVAAMVMLGGYTRLSGSGLSITEWKPIHGIIPPLNEGEWREEFDAYRASPQYEKINAGMALAEFKIIFWPEYWHRVLGRLIGVAFLIPWCVFAVRRSFSLRFGLRLAGIFALGGLQGVVGWLMVKSGLIDQPYVSHIKLTLHLSIAFLIFGLLLWAWLDTHAQKHTAGNSPLLSYLSWFALLCLQIILGAMVAGTHAGLIYNTWPTMNGQWIPSGLFETTPWFENLILIQFLHRKAAVLLVIWFIFWWYYHRGYVKNNHLGNVGFAVVCVLCLQFILGMFALLHQVPLILGLAHQMTALLLFALSVVLLHGLNRLRRIVSA